MAQPEEPHIVKNLGPLAASGADAGQIADAAVAAWTAIDGVLSPIVGPRGIAALYKRSVHLTLADYPWLAAACERALEPGDFAFLRAALSQQTAQHAAAAQDVMLQTFQDLLDNLIGRSLTQRLLQPLGISLSAAPPCASLPRDEVVNQPADSKQGADAMGVVAALEAQADTLRAELLRLRQELAQVERDFGATRGADPGQALGGLREANEKLVLAALESQELEATAQAAYRRQIAFLATVAHELRNPLMPLRLATHMLSRARMDEAAHTKLQTTITGQVGQMTRLINDLLDGSRISTGKLRLERTLIDLSGVVELAAEACRPAMVERSHSFSVVTPFEPIKVLGDAVRLAQVFGNLLGNAAKYTPEGGEISLQAAVIADTVAITVSDNGIGISGPALPHVFDLFVQDARATVISPGGLGIGLAVVRELVKAHEGSVVARSAGPDRGSQFVVMLPLARGGSAVVGSA